MLRSDVAPVVVADITGPIYSDDFKTQVLPASWGTHTCGIYGSVPGVGLCIRVNWGDAAHPDIRQVYVPSSQAKNWQPAEGVNVIVPASAVADAHRAGRQSLYDEMSDVLVGLLQPV